MFPVSKNTSKMADNREYRMAPSRRRPHVQRMLPCKRQDEIPPHMISLCGCTNMGTILPDTTSINRAERVMIGNQQYFVHIANNYNICTAHYKQHMIDVQNKRNAIQCGVSISPWAGRLRRHPKLDKDAEALQKSLYGGGAEYELNVMLQGRQRSASGITETTNANTNAQCLDVWAGRLRPRNQASLLQRSKYVCV